MKKFSFSQLLLLSLPVLLVVAGVLVSNWRENERKALLAYYSQPYKPQLKVERSKAPKNAVSKEFRFKAHCLSIGGSERSQWLVRGQLFDMSGKAPREIWNSQKAPGFPPSIGYSTDYSNVTGPDPEVSFEWLFSRNPKDTRLLKFVVEAVAIPIPGAGYRIGRRFVNVDEATPAQIAAAKRLPNTKHFLKSIELKASGNQS